MPKRYATSLAFSIACILAVFVTASGRAQDAAPTVTKMGRFFSHIDFGVSGTAVFTKDVTGTVNEPVLGPAYTFTQSASNTAGALVSIHYQKSPLKGFEFNYGYARNTQGYTCCNASTINGSYIGPFTAQATRNEYTVGYLARPRTKILGFQPYVSVGLGTTEFKPTRNGGVGLQPQARATYYYSLGGEAMISNSFGVRAGIRQLFYLAPDFDQNYLRIEKHTFTTEPQVGVFVHF